jgi:hypothetical protein
MQESNFLDTHTCHLHHLAEGTSMQAYMNNNELELDLRRNRQLLWLLCNDTGRRSRKGGEKEQP